MQPSVFVGTPVHSSFIHQSWVAGALSMHGAFAGRHVIELQKGSFLPRQRDQLTRKFFDSGCSHFLCVDSDIGWNAGQVQALLDTGKEFVSGIYCQKSAEKKLPFSWNEKEEGKLRGCNWAPGGFLLISRPVIERMMGAYAGMQYQSGDGTRLWALWASLFDEKEPYSSEDTAFCKRWTALGGEIWAHSGVVLDHFGETVFRP